MGQTPSRQIFSTSAEAKRHGYFSRRHETPDALLACRNRRYEKQSRKGKSCKGKEQVYEIVIDRFDDRYWQGHYQDWSPGKYRRA